MTITELLQSITECNNGQLNFNLGTNRFAFLYSKKWYPLRATVNRAKELSNENANLTKNEALVELVNILPYTRVDEIEFLNNFPVEISNVEILEEVNKISIILQQLT
jgi:hypothetical protein